MCHKFANVRQRLADELNVALMTYSDLIFDDGPDGEQKYEMAIELLSETDWKRPVSELRPIRNNLCSLLGVSVPVPVSAAKPTVSQH